jgi:large subunit ribosomal protein L35
MPKNKTHSGTAKRIRVTGSGKLRRLHTNNHHKFVSKSNSHIRRLDGTTEVAPADVKRIRRLLGR